MTHRSRRLVILATIGLALTCVAPILTVPTYASQPRTLTAGDFHEVAAQGFGDPQNSWAWSMEWFKNRLYVGTNRDFLCVEQAAFHKGLSFIPYPYQDPDLTVPCNANPQAMPVGGEVWALDPTAQGPLTQANWTRVYQSPYNVTVNITATKAITQAPRDMGFRDMLVYDDANGEQALYVSGVSTKPLNGANVPPPSLLRSTDGTTFQAVPADPGTTLGDINTLSTIPGLLGIGGGGGCCLRGAASYNGRFYIVAGQFQGAGSVLVSADPSQGDNNFQPFTPPGMAVFEMAPFNGHLYLGVQSPQGYTVVRIDANCAALPCPSSAFTTVVPPGGGVTSSPNLSITSMHVFTDTNGVPHLYVGTDGANNFTPAEIVRVNADDSWDLIMGNPRVVNGVVKSPTSGLGSGFGWWFNEHVWRLANYNGVLYAGTFDASTLWKDTALAPFLAPNMGFDLWASTDGLTFSPVTQNGFGDKFSFGARSLTATPYGLFVGSANWWKGLRLWQGAVNTDALHLAPSNMQVDSTDQHGAVTLAWNAPSAATLFHIYRAALTGAALPAPSALNPESAGAYRLLPHTIWAPGAYADVGTSATPYYVDQSAKPGTRYDYYVVAQDAAGHLSAPSNVAATGISAALTFRSAMALVWYWALRGKISAAHAGAVIQSLRSAGTRARAGDVRGSRAIVEELRQQAPGETSGRYGRLYAENLTALLNRLDERLSLVSAHVISAARL